MTLRFENYLINTDGNVWRSLLMFRKSNHDLPVGGKYNYLEENAHSSNCMT